MSTLRAPRAAARPARSWALVWVALGAGLWGTDTVLRRPLTAVMSSARIVLAEHLILTALLVPVLWRERRFVRRLGRLGWAAVLGISWGGSALGTVLFTEAIRGGNPTTAVLLQKTQPLFAALLAHALLREPLGRRFWVYLGLAVAGAYLVGFGAQLPVAALAQARAVPAVLALAAAALWGGSTVLGRFALETLSFPALTALRIVLATPLLLAAAALRSTPAPVFPGARVIMPLVLLALVPGLLALLLYYRGLRRARASLAAIAELSFPAVAALLNWVFLGARVTPVQAAGFVLLWGVILKLDQRFSKPAPRA